MTVPPTSTTSCRNRSPNPSGPALRTVRGHRLWCLPRRLTATTSSSQWLRHPGRVPSPRAPMCDLNSISLLPNYREQHWYRTKPAAVVVAVAVIAAVMCGGWFVLRSPSTAAEQSSTEAPTSAPPAPSKASPTAVSAPNPRPRPAPPPPPPPPPPPAEPTYSAPQRQYQPRYSEPSPAEKPRVDVTRAPMSVAPVPKPVPGSDSNTPGDAPGEKPRRRGCFGFC